MIVITVKKGERIDKYLKKYKKKFDETKVLKEVRKRLYFVKKSVLRRNEVLKAKYINKVKLQQDL